MLNGRVKYTISTHSHLIDVQLEKIEPHNISVELKCQEGILCKSSLMYGSIADAFWGKGFLDSHLTASPDRKKTWKEQDCSAEIMATIIHCWSSIWNTQLHIHEREPQLGIKLVIIIILI